MLPNTSLSVGHVYVDVHDVPVRPPMQLGVIREPYKCMTTGNSVMAHHLRSYMSDNIVNAYVSPTYNSTINNNNGTYTDRCITANAIDSNAMTSNSNSNITISTPKQERPQFIIPPRPPSEIGNDSKANNNSWLSLFGYRI